jgi:hypothetical protein
MPAEAHSIVQLTNNTVGDGEPDIDAGQVTWRQWDGTDWEIMLYDGTGTVQLSNNSYEDYWPQIDAGQVCWSGWDGNDWEIFFYDGSTTLQLTDDSYDQFYAHIDAGQVTWFSTDGEVYLYDGTGTVQITNNSYEDSWPTISNGQVAWIGYPDGNPDVFLYDGSSIIRLTYTSGYEMFPDIDFGQVTWFANHVDGSDNEIFLYDGTSTIQLTSNDYDDSDPKIDDGQVTWWALMDKGEIFLYDGSRIIQLTDDTYDHWHPSIDAGQVTWSGQVSSNNKEIFIYDGASTIRLTNNNYDADSYPQIDSGQVTWGEYDGSDVEIFLYDPYWSNRPPNDPVNLSPVNGSINLAIVPTLHSSAFSDPDLGDTHAASQWQIRTSSGSYSSPIFDTGVDDSNLTSITIPSGVLSYSTTYYWHVRYQDNHDAWSSWSVETSFTTAMAPAGCPQVSSATGTGSTSFCATQGTLGNLTAVPENALPAEGKPNLEFPHGFFSFEITGLASGETVTLTITLPSAAPVGTQYWKYGPTQENNLNHWYQIPMGDDDGDNVITITLVDGGLGDDDLTANGVIVDQGGPGNPPAGGRGVPAFPSLYIGVAAALAAGILAYFVRRRAVAG